MTFTAKNISISINSPKDKVYKYASNPENFPRWLAFLKSISKKTEKVWSADTDLGKIEFELTPKNEYGIIDQLVKLTDGTSVCNPLRVIKNDNGSEVIFTLFKMPGKTDDDFEKDAKMVEADLKTLKEILENDKNTNRS